MIVCVCNVVSDRDIKEAVNDGAECIEQLSDRLNIGMCCGVCTDTASECLSNALVKKTALQPAG